MIRVLIVDDSAFVRKVVREMLSSEADLEVVGVARDGEQALEMTASLVPDIVVTDLVMPKVDGVAFVRQQMKLRPVPILILSSAAQDAAEVVDALNAGALDIVQKPTALATDDLLKVRAELVQKIRATQGVAGSKLSPLTAPSPVALTTHATGVGVVVIGISTGGPQALRQVLPALPADFPVPIAVVLHMPVGYTAMYAEKLNEICALEVHEAVDGEHVKPGTILIAAAGRHLLLRREGTAVVARMSVHPLEKLHRPSADVLFQSAADTYGARVLAVVMTGMGDDGKEGAGWIKAAGGTVLTEDEKSCIIYGMPRSVVEAGLSDAAFTLGEMARAITARL